MKTVDRESKRTPGGLPYRTNDQLNDWSALSIWGITCEVVPLRLLKFDTTAAGVFVVLFWGYLTLRSYTLSNEPGPLVGQLNRPSRFKIVPASYCCFIARFMYPSGVFWKICYEHSRHYSTILLGTERSWKI